MLTKDIPFFDSQNCLLRDKLATCLMGETVLLGTGSKTWTFESEELAETYLLLCIIFCCGGEEYYLHLHRKARRTC
jgi:hypothetical protein